MTVSMIKGGCRCPQHTKEKISVGQGVVCRGTQTVDVLSCIAVHRYLVFMMSLT